MMDCKGALLETDGDMEAAIDWLRKKGLSKAAKKSGRIAAEGLVGVVSEANKGAVVEVNSETDFVARNPQFQEMVSAIAKLAHGVDGDFDKLLASAYPGANKSVEAYVTELVATIGENMSVRRCSALSVSDGVVAGYVHNQAAPGLGTIGVLVALESKGDAAKLQELGRNLAMHVAAMNPIAVRVEELNERDIARERAVYLEQARQTGKPEEIIEKMVEGRLRKEFFQQSVLLQQAYVRGDGKETVEKAVKAAESDVGAAISVANFVRYALGEGIDKKDDDFAAEVAAAAKGG
jgi:elongation factor Ts